MLRLKGQRQPMRQDKAGESARGMASRKRDANGHNAGGQSAGGQSAGGLAPAGQDARTVRRRPIDLAALNDHLGYSIRRLQIWIFQDFIRSLAEVDIRPAQYSVLVVIGANAGLSQADLAEALGIERARMVHLLDRLEQRGLIERQPSNTDRRSHALHLTKEGQRVLRRARALAASHEERLSGMLGETERVHLLDLMRKTALPPG